MKLQTCRFVKSDARGVPDRFSGTKGIFKSDLVWQVGVACVKFFNDHSEIEWVMNEHGERYFPGLIYKCLLSSDRPGCMLYTDET